MAALDCGCGKGAYYSQRNAQLLRFFLSFTLGIHFFTESIIYFCRICIFQEINHFKPYKYLYLCSVSFFVRDVLLCLTRNYNK